MTDDTDGNDHSQWSRQMSEAQTGSYTEPFSRTDWEQLKADPNLEADLGYEWVEWERFDTLDDTDQVMFLPEDEESLRDAEFLVIESDDLVTLGEFC